VILAGGVESSVAQALVERHFAAWSGKAKVQEPQLSDEPEGRVAYVIDFPGATQSSLAIARRAGSDGDPNYFAEEVMNDRLGGSFTSRINMNLREDKGYTYVAQSVFNRYHYAGYWGIFSDVISEATGASIKEIFGELGSVCSQRPFSEGERNEAVEGMLLGFVMDFAETNSVGLRLASLPLRDRPVDFWSTWPEQVASVTTARANEVAQPYCDLDQFSVVAAGDAQKLTAQLQALGLRIVAMDRDGHLVRP
jgi:zinc protease